MIELPGLWSALLPVWLPLAALPLVYFFRRQAFIAALLASTVLGVIAWWLVVNPATNIDILGRELLLSGIAQVLLVALAIWLIIAFLFAWRISQGWTLFPVLLLVYSLITAALLFEELVVQVLLLKIAWLVMILLVQGGTKGTTRAATRLLILAVLAVPPFLLAATLITQRVFQPESAETLTSIIVLALGIGFALMLAIIPFHAWFPQVVEDGPPLVAAWLVAGMGGSYLIILFDLLGRYQWLAENEQVQRILFRGGLLLAIGGALLIVTERHLGRLWSYAVLADLGYILLGFSFASRPGMLAALLLIISRLVNLLLAGAALATIRHHATSLYFDQIAGVGPRVPLSIFAFAIGGLAMLGAPLTAGFPGHWAVLRLMVQTDSGWAVALVSTSLLGSIGFLRAFAVMANRVDEDKLTKIKPEPRIATFMLSALAGLSILIGLAPQTMNPVLAYLLRSLNFF